MSSQRIKIGFILELDTPPALVQNFAKFAESAGFDSLWIGEPPVFMHGPVILTLAATATSTLPLGFGLTNPYTRRPSVNAMLAASIDDLSNQRFILTLGAGSLEGLQGLGLDWDRPVQHIRDTIEICRRLWTGEVVSYQGETISIKGSRLQFPPKRSDIPIFIGCRRPHMTQLSGELADGIILDNAPVSYLDYVDKQLKIGAKRSGRTLSQSNFTLANMCAWAISKDREEAKKRAAYNLPLGLVTISEKEIIDAGFTNEDLDPIKKAMFTESPTAYEDAGSLVTRPMVDAFSISGTPEDVVEKISQYEKNGLDHLILGLPTDPKVKPWKTVSLFRDEVLPHFRD